LPGDWLARRGAEYHVALLASLLGMLVLAAARDLVLLFVAFELMSIPLYVLTGFPKSTDVAPEGALKFFLVGSVSSAVLLYGFSFIYGATNSTSLAGIPAALAAGSPLVKLGLVLALAGVAVQVAGGAVPRVGAGARRGRAAPDVAWTPGG